MNKIDIRGTWRLSGTGTELPPAIQFPLPAEIPGDNLTALRRSEAVREPNESDVELELQWIGRTDWTFQRTVSVPKAYLAAQRVLLRFESVDTVAEIAVNGVVVAESDNMFAGLEIDLTGTELIVAGENTIAVRIRAPETEAVRRATELDYPVPHTSFPVQSPHRNLLRKGQCHAGWDWGPALMVSGIYGYAELVFAGEAVIQACYTEVLPAEDQDWTVRVHVDVLTSVGTPLQVRVEDQSGSVVAESSSSVPGGTVLGDGPATVHVDLSVRNPQIWWPSGWGEQPLYTVVVEAGDDFARRQIGFRRVQVLRDEDEYGTGFTFVVNGRPLFAKGANWIPVDALPGRITRERTEYLLRSAVDANMNMIRVWGGGVYESDWFYEACNRLGILIWQDFMFACALYPATPAFLESVKAESEYQVKRLMSHPSIALWCGNNENLGALSWFQDSRTNRDRYVVDFDRLYEGTIGTVVRALDPGRQYWPSSPSAGPGDYSDNWHDDSKGDMHFWSVWHEGAPFSAYRSIVPRFCSEFGFQSFPSLSSVRTYARPSHFNVTAPDMEHHQRHNRGNTLIVQTLSRYFRFPTSFARVLYASQAQQAMAIQTAVEYWRSQRPRCMGALIWQLNDNWPVASWSTIEYNGKWKLLHYAAKRFFAARTAVLIPSDSSEKEESWSVYVINDATTHLDGVVYVRFFGFDGTLLSENPISLKRLPADSSTTIWSFGVDELPASPQQCFVVLDLQASGGDAVCEQQYFLTQPKRCDLPPATVSLKASAAGGQIAVELDTDRPAFFVGLDADDTRGVFSDNFLFLAPGKRKTVQFAPEAPSEPDRLAEKLTVWALNQE